MRPQAEAKAEAEVAQPDTSSASSAAASSASASTPSASTPSCSSADSPAAQARAVALGVFAGRSRPKPRTRTLNAMFGGGSPPRATRATARSPLVEGAPSVASPSVPEEEEATVERVEAMEGVAPVAQSDRLSGEEADSTAESLLSEQELPLAAAVAVTELPPVTPRDKSPAAPFRPAPPLHEKLLEKLLEEKLQGPKNWLEGIKNGLPISKPSSAPSGPLCGPCKSCVSRGKPLQLAASLGPSDVLLLDLRDTAATTTRSTEPLSVSVA